MVNYALIHNEKLRQLVILSESIHSLPMEEIIVIVQKMAALPEAMQTAMIKTLEDEQRQIAAAKLAKGITPAIEEDTISNNMAQVNAMQRQFDTTIRKDQEQQDNLHAQQAAETLLKNI